MRESVQSLSFELDVFPTAGDMAISSRATFSRLAQVQLELLLRTVVLRRPAKAVNGPAIAGRDHQAQLRRCASPRVHDLQTCQFARLPRQRTLIENASNNEVDHAKLIASLSACPLAARMKPIRQKPIRQRPIRQTSSSRQASTWHCV